MEDLDRFGHDGAGPISTTSTPEKRAVFRAAKAFFSKLAMRPICPSAPRAVDSGVTRTPVGRMAATRGARSTRRQAVSVIGWRPVYRQASSFAVGKPSSSKRANAVAVERLEPGRFAGGRGRLGSEALLEGDRFHA